MNIESLRELALAFPHATEEIKWDTNLCFMVFDKIFLIVNVNTVPTRCSFKVEKENFEEVAAQDNFKQAPYLARGQWVMLDDISLLNENEFKLYINTSFELIKSKLPKKLQTQL